MEGLGGSRVAQGTLGVSLAHRAMSPLQRAATSGTFLPPQQRQRGGDWSPEPGQASVGDVRQVRAGGHREHQNLLLPALEQCRDTGGDTGHKPTPRRVVSQPWSRHQATGQKPKLIHTNS